MAFRNLNEFFSNRGSLIDASMVKLKAGAKYPKLRKSYISYATR